MARPRQSKVKRPLPNWLKLPPEVMATILLKIGAIEILTSAQKVCTSWWKICKDPLMWRSIDMHHLGEPHISSYSYELIFMAMHAIDRSCGGLVEISIENFGTDQLLEYITARKLNWANLILLAFWLFRITGGYRCSSLTTSQDVLLGVVWLAESERKKKEGYQERSFPGILLFFPVFG